MNWIDLLNKSIEQNPPQEVEENELYATYFASSKK